MRRMFGIMVLSSIMFLTGCSSNVSLSDQDTTLVAEYIASVALKHDKKNEYKLVDLNSTNAIQPTQQPTSAPSNEPESPTPTKSPTSTDSKPSKEEPKKSITLTSLYGIPGIEVSYVGSKECSTYPNSNSTYSVSAKKGNKLVVTTLKVTNTTSESKKLNLMGKQILFYLKTQGKTGNSSILTALEDDIQFFNETLGPKKSLNLVVVFDVEQKTTLKDMVFFAMKGKQACEIQVK